MSDYARAFNVADPSERAWLRRFLDPDTEVGIDLHPIAADLHCKPTRASILATLDLLDGGEE